MNSWAEYPDSYRQIEVRRICAAVSAGECVSIVGLSGSGKSNLMGFLARRVTLAPDGPAFLLVDANRLTGSLPEAFFRLMRSACGNKALSHSEADELAALENALDSLLQETPGVCFLIDRFDALTGPAISPLHSALRALRDEHKYALTYVVAARNPLEPTSELAELFFGNTLWLGPLAHDDAVWSARRFAARKNLGWEPTEFEQLVEISWGYPSLLRGACEAYASGALLSKEALRQHPAVQRRIAEFWVDQPTPEALQASGLIGHPLLKRDAGPTIAEPMDTPAELTAKEHLLLEYLQMHSGKVCEKDELIHAIWPEDRIFTEGIRDDSLAQVVRRLRKKIERDPGNPEHLLTAPGRGYRWKE